MTTKLKNAANRDTVRQWFKDHPDAIVTVAWLADTLDIPLANAYRHVRALAAAGDIVCTGPEHHGIPGKPAARYTWAGDIVR